MSEMRVDDRLWKGVQIVVWLLVGSAWFFGDNAVVKERVAVLEARIEENTRGYSVMQSSVSQRMERLETTLNDRLDKVDRKLDCLVNRVLCR